MSDILTVIPKTEQQVLYDVHDVRLEQAAKHVAQHLKGKQRS